MIPADQVRTGAPMGQCTEASIASVLEVELHEVPDLWGGPGAEDRPVAQWVRLLGFIVSRGYQYISLRFDPVPFAGELDLDALGVGGMARELAEGWHLIGGSNPDGLGHFVVGRGGRLEHDPNPSRRGLVEVDELVVFMPLEKVERDRLGWLMREYRRVGDEWHLTTESA